MALIIMRLIVVVAWIVVNKMKVIHYCLLLIVIFFIKNVSAEIKAVNPLCGLYNESTGAELNLGKYIRVSELLVVNVAETFFNLQKDDKKNIYIPRSEYDVETVLTSPFKGVKYKNTAEKITVMAVEIQYNTKNNIKSVFGDDYFKEYKYEHVFDYVKKSLGQRNNTKLCSMDEKEELFSFLMAASIVPMFGDGLTSVYFIDELGAIFLSKKSGAYIEFIYPKIGENETLVHVRVYGLNLSDITG